MSISAHTVELRPYREAEVEELQQIERAANRRYSSLRGFEKFTVAPTITPERFEIGFTTVAEVDRHPVGYVIVQPLDDMLYVASLMVHDELSGRGIGRKLLEWAERQAAATEARAVCLTTFRDPRWNAPWYRRLGYTDMHPDKISAGLRTILDRHATFLDMTMRVTMWKPTEINA